MHITFDILRIDSVSSASRFLITAFSAIALCGGCNETGSGESSSSNRAGAGGASGSAGTPPTGGASGSDGEAPAPRVGWFNITLVAPVAATTTTPSNPGFTSVNGKVCDAPEPEGTIWEKTLEEGECELLEPRVPFCDPLCGEAVCVEDGQCAAYPPARDVGTVTVHGLQTADGANPVTLVSVRDSYSSTDALPYPAFAEGDEIRLQASGGDYEPFSILSKGIVPLELTVEGEIHIEREQPMTLAWTPPGNTDIARIHVKVDISHHGGAKGKIECDAPDTGSLQIPAALVTRLIDLGYSGFPSVNVTRSAIGSVVIAPGRVELTVQSAVDRGLQIPGLISCSESIPCPEGLTCQQDLKCL